MEIFEHFFIQNFRPWIWIQHPKFSLMAAFYFPRVGGYDFMVKIDLIIYNGFDREIVQGVTLHP